MKDLQNLSKEERIDLLKSNADDVYNDKIPYHFSEAEIAEKRRVISNRTVEITDKEKEKKEKMAEYNKELKDLKAERDELAQQVKAGKDFFEGKVFLLLNHETSKAEFWSENDDFLDQRPMTESEKSNMTVHAQIRENS